MKWEKLNPFPPYGWLFLICWTCLLAFSCYSSKEEPPQAEPEGIVEPVDAGNGVFYFEATGDQYMRSVAKFEIGPPVMQCSYRGPVEAVASKAYGTFHIIGHILHCSRAEIPAQEMTVP